MRFELALDARLPLAPVENHEIFSQAILIVLERLDLDRAAGAATGRQEAMAVGLRSGADLLHIGPLRKLAAANHERHDAPPVHEDQPADRARKDEIALAV